MTQSILITGVAGLIGSQFAQWVVKYHPECKVIGVDDLSGGFRSNVPKEVIFYPYDILWAEMEQVFSQHQPELVYHFAAYAAECLSPFIRKYNYRNNLVGTANIVNNCIKYPVKRLVFTSSMAVYGPGMPPFKEDARLEPIDPYGVAKAACEADIRIAGSNHDLEWCILRPHNVYGANQNIWDPYRNFIGICMYKILTGDPLTIFGDGLQERAFSYINDTLEPMWKAGTDIRARKEIINIGSSQKVTILKAAQTVIDVAQELRKNGQWPPMHEWVEPKLIHLPPRHEVRHAFSTYEKSQRALDFKDMTDLHYGIKQMWLWVLKQPYRERKVWDAYEVDKGIYPYWKQEALKDGFWRAASSGVDMMEDDGA